jgi:hypothetical protein
MCEGEDSNLRPVGESDAIGHNPFEITRPDDLLDVA